MTNRMDNMTREEREACYPYPQKNYIISQCCSVDDLRCYLIALKPITRERMVEVLEEINEAISFENSKPEPRVTIVKMLEAKWRSIQKTFDKSFI